MDGFSTRGASNLIEIMARIPESILSPSSNTDEINLSTAENWVIRNEVLDILKSSFEKGLQAHVRWFRTSSLGRADPISISIGREAFGAILSCSKFLPKCSTNTSKLTPLSSQIMWLLGQALLHAWTRYSTIYVTQGMAFSYPVLIGVWSNAQIAGKTLLMSLVT